MCWHAAGRHRCGDGAHGPPAARCAHGGGGWRTRCVWGGIDRKAAVAVCVWLMGRAESGSQERLPPCDAFVGAAQSGDLVMKATAARPQSFKSLVGRGHQEFSSAKQQDALEYFGHLLEQVRIELLACVRPAPASPMRRSEVTWHNPSLNCRAALVFGRMV